VDHPYLKFIVRNLKWSGVLVMIFDVACAQSTNRENYDIKIPRDMGKACGEFYGTLNAMPFDVRFSTFIRGDSVLLTHSDADWFWKLVPDKNDGIAVDLVFREQYACDNIQRMVNSGTHRGFLLPPLYRDNIRRNLLRVAPGYIAVYAGKVPPSWPTDNLEANYLLINNKNACYYSNVVSLDYHGWALLKTGLYYDTLGTDKLREKFQEVSKTLHFVIPFEKDKWEYRDADIRPLYDSLKLTDYAIKAIRIHAYTSVEGSTERNQMLQTRRAESIVRSLQSFQPEHLESSVQASENWVEFLNDIAGTPFANLASQSKEETKERLRAPDLLLKMEPILRKHRKAIVELDLEKRISYLTSSPADLKKFFGQQLAEKNLEEALYLQQIIFYRIGKHELPAAFLDELNVPEGVENGSLLINNASFRFEQLDHDVATGIRVFEKLDLMLKNNPKIKYNLCALKLQAWLTAPRSVDFITLKKEIESLRRRGIPDASVRRLQINYYIILSDIQLSEKNYQAKNQSIKFIYDSYKPLRLQDADLLNLAKYFSYNSRFEWAESILQPRTKALEASEDLLFYYLNLTLFEEKNTKNNSYRAVMLNAINVNHDRFCTLFNSRKKGGITFQLLNDPYLKKTYCENCQ
jgi:hypothetical protein